MTFSATGARAARPHTRGLYMFGMAVDAVGNGMYIPMSLLYFHYVTGLALTQVGAIATLGALLALVGNPVSGILVDRFGPRAVVVGGYLLRAVGFAAFPLVHSGVEMFAVLAPVALGEGSYQPAIQSLIATIAQGGDRDRLIAAQRSIRNAGLGAGGLIASGAFALGHDSAFYVVVGANAVSFALAGLSVALIPVPPARPGRAGRPTAAERGERRYRAVLRNRPFTALTLANVPTAFGYLALSVVLPVYVIEHLHAPTFIPSLLYALNTVGIAALQVPVSRSIMRRFRRTRSAALGCGIFSAAFVAFAAAGFAPGRSVVLVGVFAATALFTAGELLQGATASALVSNAAPEESRGRHLAFYQLSWAVPTAAAPAVLTSLLAFSATAMWVLLAAGVAASALALLALESHLPVGSVWAQPSPNARSTTWATDEQERETEPSSTSPPRRCEKPA